MIGSRDSLHKIDLFLVVVVTLIISIGILMIYSAGYDPIEQVNNGMYKKQILWFIIGFVFMIFFALFNYQALGTYSLFIFIGVLFILLLTSLLSTPIRGIRAWISIGGSFSIQPSEFMKLAYVILLSKYLEFRERDIRSFRELLIPALLTIVPVVIIMAQPDFGTATIFLPMLFIMLFVGGADVVHLISIILIAVLGLLGPMVLTYWEYVKEQKRLHPELFANIKQSKFTSVIVDFFSDLNTLFVISGLILVIAIVAFVLHFFSTKKILRKIYIPSAIISLGLLLSVLIQKGFQTYQKMRILIFMDPEISPDKYGYNIIQSKIAIGSGGFFGKGFLKGSQAQLEFLPEKTTDFIFSVFAEEWGFVGAIILISLFALLIFRGIQIAFEARDKFGALLASGITSIFFFHTLINIGMVIGILPVTGLPLSFVSYGGSNMLVSMIGIGILINIRSRKLMH